IEASEGSEEVDRDAEQLLDVADAFRGREDDCAILDLKLRVAIGDDDLAVTEDGADAYAIQRQILQRLADDRRGFECFRLHQLAPAVADAVHRADAAAADMLEDTAHRDGAWVDL